MLFEMKFIKSCNLIRLYIKKNINIRLQEHSLKFNSLKNLESYLDYKQFEVYVIQTNQNQPKFSKLP